MGDNRLIVFQVDQQILCSPAKGKDLLSGCDGGEIIRKGKAQISTAKLQPRNRRAHHRWRQSTLDRLHLWQFGHEFLTSCSNASAAGL